MRLPTSVMTPGTRPNDATRTPNEAEDRES